MRVLLFAMGLLAMASGGLKFRERIMNRIGTSPFALGELGTGVVACACSVLVANNAAVHTSVVGVALVAMGVATYHQSKLTAAFQKRRELSESHRLRQFLQSHVSTETSPTSDGVDHGTQDLRASRVSGGGRHGLPGGIPSS